MGACASREETTGFDDQRSSTLPTPRDKKTRDGRSLTFDAFSDIEFPDEAAIVRIPFFEELTGKRLKVLTTLFQRSVFKQGELLIEEGKQADHFHVIVSGKARVTSMGPDGAEVELAVKGKGDFFMEEALLGDAMVPITVRALVDCVVLRLDRASFAQFSDECGFHASLSQIGDFKTPLVVLRELPLFRDVDPRKAAALASLFQFRRVPGGEQICYQGDEAKGFYIIVRGRLDVMAHRATQETGDTGDVHLSTLVEGDWFGEMAFLENTMRTASVRASMDCVLLYLNKERFRRFIGVAPEILETEQFRSMMRRRTAGSLKTVDLFRSLRRKQRGPLEVFDDERLQLLGGLFRFVQYEADEFVYRVGDVADAFFIIVNGCVDIICNASSDEFGSSASSRASSRAASRAPSPRARPMESPTIAGAAMAAAAGALRISPTHAAANAESASLLTTPQSATSLASAFPETVVVDRLVQNDWFGEYALVADTVKRFAAAKATQPTLVLRLESADFQRFLELAPGARERMDDVLGIRTERLLQTMPFFRAVRENKPWSKLALLGALFKIVTFDDGEFICRKGELGDAFFLIVEGEMKVCVEGDQIDSLGPNAYFGEMSLLHRVPRMADVISVGYSVVLKLSRDRFQSFTKVAPELSRSFKELVNTRTANHLRTLPLFRDIRENKPWSKLELLATLMRWEGRQAGDYVFRQGDQGDKLWIVANGTCRVLSKTDTDESTELSVLKTGDYFGEIALLQTVTRTASVVCSGPCVFLTLTKSCFDKFLQVAPEVRSIVKDLLLSRRKSLSAKGVAVEDDQDPEIDSDIRAFRDFASVGAEGRDSPSASVDSDAHTALLEPDDADAGAGAAAATELAVAAAEKDDAPSPGDDSPQGDAETAEAGSQPPVAAAAAAAVADDGSS